MTTPRAVDTPLGRIVDTRLDHDAQSQIASRPDLGAANALREAALRNPLRDAPMIWLEEPFETPSGRCAHLSLRELVSHADSVARGYHEIGVVERDVVALYMRQEINYLVHFLALTSLGAVPALLNRRLAGATAAEFVSFIRARIVVCDDSADRELAGHGVVARRVGPEQMFRDASAPLPPRYPYPHADDDPVLITHSSGTTGFPKAVVFQNAPLLFGPRARLAASAELDERILCTIPMSHNAGIAFPLLALLGGSPLLIMTSQVGEPVLRHIEAFRPTKVVGFAQTFSDLAARDLGRWDVASVRYWSSTADSVHEAHIRRLLGAVEGAQFIDNLGSSELAFALFRKVFAAADRDFARCVGRPMSFVTTAVLSPDGDPLPDGNAGLLGVKSPTLCAGYWNDSARTYQARKSGYWLTGDVVIRQPSGEFLHLDRQVDTVRSAQGPVHTLPIEERLLLHSAEISDCSVVAAQRNGGGELPVAVLKLQRPDGAAPGRWLEALNADLTRHGHSPLAGVAIARTAAEFPLGPTGKVLKRRLRELQPTLFSPTNPAAAVTPALAGTT